MHFKHEKISRKIAAGQTNWTPYLNSA